MKTIPFLQRSMETIPLDISRTRDEDLEGTVPGRLQKEYFRFEELYGPTIDSSEPGGFRRT